MSVKLNSQTLAEKLKKSLESINEKFEELQENLVDSINPIETINEKMEELQIMYDNLIEWFQKIKNFVKNKKSNSSLDYEATTTIELDNLDRLWDGVRNLSDAKKAFGKLKEKIEMRDSTIKRQNEQLKSKENSIQELNNMYEEQMKNNMENKLLIKDLKHKIATSQEFTRAQIMEEAGKHFFSNNNKIYELRVKNQQWERKYNELLSYYNQCQDDYQLLLKKNTELVKNETQNSMTEGSYEEEKEKQTNKRRKRKASRTKKRK